MIKPVKIVISPVTGASKSRIIELYDVHFVDFKNDFHSINRRTYDYCYSDRRG